MWAKQILLGIIGLSAGLAISSGLFAFISSLGVVSDLADRTHTGSKVLLYQDASALGGIVGNLVWIYRLHIPGGNWFLGIFGIFSGIFVGCWTMALAEVLNVFPIFVRRTKLLKTIPYIILSVAIGKGVGALLFWILG